MKKFMSIAALVLFVIGVTGCKSMKKADACCGADGECCKTEAAHGHAEGEEAHEHAEKAEM